MVVERLSTGEDEQDCGRFLHEFTILHRRIRTSCSSFSVKCCTCKLSLCNGVPLVRPLRAERACGVESFIVMLSADCSIDKRLIRRFLRRAFAVLARSSDFFIEGGVHVVRYSSDMGASRGVASRGRVGPLLGGFALMKNKNASFEPTFSCIESLLSGNRLGGVYKLVCFASNGKVFPTGYPSCGYTFISINTCRNGRIPP